MTKADKVLFFLHFPYISFGCAAGKMLLRDLLVTATFSTFSTPTETGFTYGLMGLYE
jgi:hypothetical protein